MVKLDLNPAKIPVSTSIGTLYVRRIYPRDFDLLTASDPIELGRATTKLICNLIEDRKDKSPLPDEVFEKISRDDILALLPAIAKQGRLNLTVTAGVGLKDLGSAVLAAKKDLVEQNKKMLEIMRKSIEGNYGFLKERELENLQAQMAGIGDIASSIPEFDPGYVAKLTAEQFAKSAYPSLDDPAMRVAASITATQELNDNYHEELRIHSRQWMPPPVEDTPLGRAVLESAAHSEEVASKVESLVGLVAGLNQTLVKDVLPAWFRQVETDQQAAKVSFDHAAKQLRWAIIAVFVSAVVTIIATWWQIYVTREIDHENAEQQKRVEDILREQLVQQQKLIGQQAQDAAAMRASIADLKRAKKLSSGPARNAGLRP